MSPARGGVYRVSLPDIGQKLALVVSWDAINRGLRRPIIARITSIARQRSLPTHVELQPGEGGVQTTSYVLCHDLLTLREEYFGEQIGFLPVKRLLEVEAALQRALDLAR